MLDLGGYFFSNATQALLFGIGLFLVVTLPIFGMFIAGFRLLTGTSTPKWLSWTLSFVWLVVVVLLLVTGLNLANDFRRDTTVRTEAAITQPVGNTLYLDMLEPANGSSKDGA